MEAGFENKGLRVNLEKTKVMVSGDNTKDGLSESLLIWCLQLENDCSWCYP